MPDFESSRPVYSGEMFREPKPSPLEGVKPHLKKIIADMKRLRVGHGSGGELSYVAAGFLDAVIKTDQALMHFAGGRAVLEGAGGIFVDFTGHPAPTYFDKNKSINYIACSNITFANEILSYLQYS